MMDIANHEQAERWNSGDDLGHWVTNQARYDRMLEPFAVMILDAAAIGAGDRVLDIGCGCGATTRAAAVRAVTGEVTGVDLSAAMLAMGRADAETAGLSNVSFTQADAQVHPFAPGSFDAVISRFGVMFFADPVAAFANMRAAADGGARLAFVCWQPAAENEWLLVTGAALGEHLPLPDPAPADAPGMFALADPDRVRSILTDAGWRDIQLTAARTPMLVGGGGTVDDAVAFLRTGSLGRTMLAGADPVTAAQALDSLHAALTPHADSDGVRLSAAVWLVRAVA
jgi:SAM-dependent methyltransferase